MRRSFFQFLLSTCLVFLMISSNAFSSNLTPVGYWDQFDDQTGQLQSIMKLWQVGDEIKGAVVKGFPINGKEPNHICTNCPLPFKDKKIIGLPIIWGGKYNSKNDRWEGGRVLDPNNGHIYRLLLTLKQDGEKLVVRGYFGITLLGRSQTWVRITPAQMKAQLAKLKY